MEREVRYEVKEEKYVIRSKTLKDSSGKPAYHSAFHGYRDFCKYTTHYNKMEAHLIAEQLDGIVVKAKAEYIITIEE